LARARAALSSKRSAYINRFDGTPNFELSGNRLSVRFHSKEETILNAFSVIVRTSLCTCLLLAVGAVAAQAPMPEQAAPAPDNTKVNERDRSKSEPTADQQKENRSDRDITQQIRQSIMSDKSLSTYAQNVKIITQSGQVTLKGPVRSDDEKRSIEAKAIEVAGQNRVTSELNIKPQQ
jgi:hyperosmotically inducible protein